MRLSLYVLQSAQRTVQIETTLRFPTVWVTQWQTVRQGLQIQKDDLKRKQIKVCDEDFKQKNFE